MLDINCHLSFAHQLRSWELVSGGHGPSGLAGAGLLFFEDELNDLSKLSTPWQSS